jgi:hypothetical protein
MLIATSLVAAVFASPAFGAGAAAPVAAAYASMPPLIVNVSAAPNISASLVSCVLAETDAVWRGSGVRFVWRRVGHDAVPPARTIEAGFYLPSMLRVVIGNETMPALEAKLPLGWIRFDDGEMPEHEIHLSYPNVGQLMAAARDVIGNVSQMPVSQREFLTGRALGRVLAHELGHYLLASKVHTKRGLMKGSRSAIELFELDARDFQIDPAQRQVMAARLRRESLIVSR